MAAYSAWSFKHGLAAVWWGLALFFLMRCAWGVGRVAWLLR